MGTPPPILVANIGMADTFILMILALVVFGPRRLPEIGRQIGKLMFEFRKASNDFKFQMEEELRAAEEVDRRQKEEAERQRVAALAAQSQASVSAPAQTVEASADIGAVEPPASSTYPETYPAETPSAAAEAALTIQPPSTGEPIAAAAPSSAIPEPAVTEVNQDADASANAAGLSAAAGASTGEVQCEATAAPIHNPETTASTPPKETVSQHG